MPRADEGFPNASGLAFEGDVLTRKFSVQEAFVLESARLLQTTSRGQRVAPRRLPSRSQVPSRDKMTFRHPTDTAGNCRGPLAVRWQEAYAEVAPPPTRSLTAAAPLGTRRR